MDDSYQEDSYDEQFLSESMGDPLADATANTAPLEQAPAEDALPKRATPKLGALPPLGIPSSADATRLYRTSSFEDGFSSPPVGGAPADFAFDGAEDFQLVGSSPKHEPSPQMEPAASNQEELAPLPPPAVDADVQAERERQAAEEYAAYKAQKAAAAAAAAGGTASPSSPSSAAALKEKLSRGLMFTSYKTGMFGKVKSSARFLRVSGENLCYGSSAAAATKTIVLPTLRELRLGSKASKTLTSAKLSAAQSDCALSIVAPNKTLDLLAPSPEERDEWSNFLAAFTPARRAFRP